MSTPTKWLSTPTSNASSSEPAVFPFISRVAAALARVAVSEVGCGAAVSKWYL